MLRNRTSTSPKDTRVAICKMYPPEKDDQYDFQDKQLF